MAVDDGLLAQMRDDLADFQPLREVRMFGGLCFMWRGNMLCGLHKGGALYRVGKANHARALALPGVGPMEMTGRSMSGLVDADESALADDRVRATLLKLAEEFVGGLPAK